MLTKIKISVVIAGSLLCVYALLGFYVLPTLVKSKLPTIIQHATGRKASLLSVHFDPFSLKLSLHGFELQEANGQLFIGFDAFFVDINALQSIGQRALVIDALTLNKPLINIVKDNMGAFNFQDLLKQKRDTTPSRGLILPVKIIKLSINEGKLNWEDLHFKSPEKETLYPINLSINNLSNQNDKQASLTLSLVVNSGGTFDLQGTIGLGSVTSVGHIKLDNVQLPRIWALALQDFLPLELLGYELFESDYKFDYFNNKFNLNFNQGKFELRDIQVLETKPDTALVKIPIFIVKGFGLNFEKRELTIDSLIAKDADFKVVLNNEGVFNYQTLIIHSNHELATDTQGQVAKQASWDIRIGDIAFNNFGLSFEDQTLKRPFTLTAKPINFKMSSFTTNLGAGLPFQLSFGLNDIGIVKLDGNAVTVPFSAQIAVDIKDLALGNFQAYADKFINLDIIDGALDIDGNVLVANLTPEKPDFNFTGNAKITNLLTREQLKNKDFVKWESFALKGIRAFFSANQYSAEKLSINKPYARVIIQKDKTINFGNILNTNDYKNKSKAVIKNTQTLALHPVFKLGMIEVIDGSADFADFSLILPFSVQIKNLDGVASGLSSEQKSKIKLNLKGNAYDLAPVDIDGEISPYLGDYAIKLKFTGMPMPLISSYMVQFAGYKVEKGKMSLELNYNVTDQHLSASNNIFIDQFELGEKIENPNAVSLPLKLAVALLKDSDGKIKIDVPISGSLEDPQFSVSQIVIDALANSIGKVVTSPFRALASLIGDEEDLSMISFTAGEAILSEHEKSKLDSLVRALQLRPALNLEIKGAAYQEQDWPAVSDDALYDQLKKLKAAEINKQGEKKIRPEYVVLSDQDYRRFMEELFVQNFPLLVEKSLLGVPRLVDPKAGDFYAVAKEKLSAIIKPEPQRLKDLANQRAQTIANYLVQKGGIANERIFILDTAIDPEREGKDIVSLLSLKTD